MRWRRDLWRPRPSQAGSEPHQPHHLVFARSRPHPCRSRARSGGAPPWWPRGALGQALLNGRRRCSEQIERRDAIQCPDAPHRLARHASSHECHRHAQRPTRRSAPSPDLRARRLTLTRVTICLVRARRRRRGVRLGAPARACRRLPLLSACPLLRPLYHCATVPSGRPAFPLPPQGSGSRYTPVTRSRWFPRKANGNRWGIRFSSRSWTWSQTRSGASSVASYSFGVWRRVTSARGPRRGAGPSAFPGFRFLQGTRFPFAQSAFFSHVSRQFLHRNSMLCARDVPDVDRRC